MAEKIVTSTEKIFSKDELGWLQVLFVIQMKLLMLEGQADNAVGSGVSFSSALIVGLIPEIQLLEEGVEMTSRGVNERIELFLSETLRDREIPSDVTGERISVAMTAYAQMNIEQQGWEPQVPRKNP